MPANWNSAATILDDLKDFLAKKTTGTISDRWTGIIARATGKAKSDILKVLRSSGFSTAQINGWDYLSEHHSQQAIYWCLVYGANQHNLEQNAIRMLDVRKDLQEFDTLDVGGEEVSPAAEENMMQAGLQDFTGLDFRPDSPEGDINFTDGMKTSHPDGY
jgi:hypothetical protein